MFDRKAFSELLYTTVIPASLSKEEQERLFKKVDDSAQKLLPKSLFKYRSCSEQNINAFDKDELWFASADCMNDGFDARTFVSKEDKDYVKETFESLFKGKKIDYASQQFKNLEFKFQIERNPFQPDSIDSEAFEEYKNKLMDVIRSDVDSVFPLIPSIIQTSSKLCCFSETVASTTMWGLYGENETGYCLEYSSDLLSQADSDGNRGLLFPVLYNDQRICLTREFYFFIEYNGLISKLCKASGIEEEKMKAVFLPCPDITMVIKITLTKSSDWSYEKEWRLILPNKDSSDKTKAITHKQAIGVYLGRRISPINEKIICLLAKEKNIPVYKMHINDESPSFELEYERIQ